MKGDALIAVDRCARNKTAVDRAPIPRIPSRSRRTAVTDGEARNEGRDRVRVSHTTLDARRRATPATTLLPEG